MKSYSTVGFALEQKYALAEAGFRQRREGIPLPGGPMEGFIEETTHGYLREFFQA